jgi:hypothetical protein
MTNAMLDAPTSTAAPAPAGWEAALAPTWQADFARLGYVVLPNLLDAAAIAELKPEVDAIMASQHALRAIECQAHGMLLSHPTIMAAVERLLGPGFAFHHLHSARHDAGTPGVDWHHDYEQHPQSNREHGMVHVFYYLNGLDGTVGDLLVRPGSHKWILDRRALSDCGTADLPGSIVIDRLSPGSAVIVHSACLHARRAKPGGEGRARYFIDASYCQAGIRWPSYSAADWRDLLALALQRGYDRGGRHAHLFDAAHFFDAREAWERLDRLNHGSLIEQLPRDR